MSAELPSLFFPEGYTRRVPDYRTPILSSSRLVRLSSTINPQDIAGRATPSVQFEEAPHIAQLKSKAAEFQIATLRQAFIEANTDEEEVNRLLRARGYFVFMSQRDIYTEQGLVIDDRIAINADEDHLILTAIWGNKPIRREVYTRDSIEAAMAYFQSYKNQGRSLLFGIDVLPVLRSDFYYSSTSALEISEKGNPSRTRLEELYFDNQMVLDQYSMEIKSSIMCLTTFDGDHVLFNEAGVTSDGRHYTDRHRLFGDPERRISIFSPDTEVNIYIQKDEKGRVSGGLNIEIQRENWMTTQRFKEKHMDDTSFSQGVDELEKRISHPHNWASTSTTIIKEGGLIVVNKYKGRSHRRDVVITEVPPMYPVLRSGLKFRGKTYAFENLQLVEPEDEDHLYTATDEDGNAVVYVVLDPDSHHIKKVFLNKEELNKYNSEN